jgi:hypothetical protein
MDTTVVATGVAVAVSALFQHSGLHVSAETTMIFDEVPDWVAWLAQDADGAWNPQGVGRGCCRFSGFTATLWG